MNGYKFFPPLPKREKAEETTLQKTYSNVRWEGEFDATGFRICISFIVFVELFNYSCHHFIRKVSPWFKTLMIPFI
jgi:hypothetical protein